MFVAISVAFVNGFKVRSGVVGVLCMYPCRCLESPRIPHDLSPLAGRCTPMPILRGNGWRALFRVQRLGEDGGRRSPSAGRGPEVGGLCLSEAAVPSQRMPSLRRRRHALLRPLLWHGLHRSIEPQVGHGAAWRPPGSMCAMNVVEVSTPN